MAVLHRGTMEHLNGFYKQYWFYTILILIITFNYSLSAAVPSKQRETENDFSNNVLDVVQSSSRLLQFIAPNNQVIDPEAGEPLNSTEFSNARKLVIQIPMRDKLDGGDPIEIAGLYEGDIKNPPRTVISRAKSNLQENVDEVDNAVREETLLWPKGVIPYVLSKNYEPSERMLIAKAILEYQDKTCLQFVPRTNQSDYIFITPDAGRGCSSYVGRQSGKQVVSLGIGCMELGIIIHELMHASGFWHEQSRTDRDNYVTIIWENIAQGMETNFEKLDQQKIQHLGAPYDLGSVMHYGAYAFAKNPRLPTIVPKGNSDKNMGQRDGFSSVDIRKLKLLYNCKEPEKCIDSDQNCKFWAKQGECLNNTEWMSVNCRLSCNLCGEACNDLSRECAQWSHEGQCKKNPAYMVKSCPRSCGFCGVNGVVKSSTESPDCIDWNDYCAAWAANGECEKNEAYMKTRCKKSCKVC